MDMDFFICSRLNLPRSEVDDLLCKASHYENKILCRTEECLTVNTHRHKRKKINISLRCFDDYLSYLSAPIIENPQMHGIDSDSTVLRICDTVL